MERDAPKALDIWLDAAEQGEGTGEIQGISAELAGNQREISGELEHRREL